MSIRWWGKKKNRFRTNVIQKSIILFKVLKDMIGFFYISAFIQRMGLPVAIAMAG